MANQPDSSRREFLQGTAGVRALRGAVDAVLGPAEGPGGEERTAAGRWLDLPAQADYLLTVSRRAMACTFEVHVPAEAKGAGTEAALAALDLVDELEAQMTVYRATSEVLQINQLAASRPVEVEPRLFELLQRAIVISRQTGGAFDITSGPLSEVWGFSRRQGRLPEPAEIEKARERVGYEHVVLEQTTRRVSFAQEGVTINFNSIGKGYALDRVAELLAALAEEKPIDRFLLHGGNSSVLGRVAGHDAPPWRIGIRNPVRPAERLGEVLIGNRAIGTSGSGTQYFYHGGKRYGHLLDPRTGYPAEGVLSATVLAESGADADALATAFYVMGPEAVAQYCDRHAGVSALLVSPAKTGQRVQVHLYGAPDAWWRPS